MASNKRKLSLDSADTIEAKILRTCGKPAFGLENGSLSQVVGLSLDPVPDLCGHCSEIVNTDEIEISSLQCCLCTMHYHGCCLDIDDDVLSMLYVIKNLGGWCCENCRRNHKNNKNFADPPIEASQKRLSKTDAKMLDLSNKLDKDIGFVKSQLQSIVDEIKSLSIGYIPAATEADTNGRRRSTSTHLDSVSDDPAAWSIKVSKNDTNRAKLNPSSSSSLHPRIREEVLVAMHSEMTSINRRSTAVVVTGLPSRSDVTDLEQFNNICLQHLKLSPTVKSSTRLGTKIEGRMQPLLVHLSSPNDVASLMAVAPNLRKASNDYVKTCVYINRHMTKAEATAAWRKRTARRQSPSNTTNNSASTTQSAMNPSAPSFNPCSGSGVAVDPKVPSTLDTNSNHSNNSSTSGPAPCSKN